jgi:hypothetical protein
MRKRPGSNISRIIFVRRLPRKWEIMVIILSILLIEASKNSMISNFIPILFVMYPMNYSMIWKKSVVDQRTTNFVAADYFNWESDHLWSTFYFVGSNPPVVFVLCVCGMWSCQISFIDTFLENQLYVLFIIITYQLLLELENNHKKSFY